MKITLSPLHIKLLLHAEVSFETYEPWNSSVEKFWEQLQKLGAVELNGSSLTVYRSTPLGKAWVTAICNTPPPRLAFLDVDGKEIVV